MVEDVEQLIKDKILLEAKFTREGVPKRKRITDKEISAIFILYIYSFTCNLKDPFIFVHIFY